MIVYYCDGFAGGRSESRRLLKKAISEYTGDPARAEQLVSTLKTGEQGKPYIEGFEYFSVSHTGSIWAVAVDVRECGLDIQLGKECDINAIARRIYDPKDAERIARISEEDPAGAKDEFFRIWTRREALTKAMGGSVYDTDLPSVSVDNTVAGLVPYMIADISLPGIEPKGGEKLYAAVCVEDVKGAGGNMILFTQI